MRMNEWVNTILRFRLARDELAAGVTQERAIAFQREAWLLLLYRLNGADCAEAEELVASPEWARRYEEMKEELLDLEKTNSHGTGNGETVAGGGFSARYRAAFKQTNRTLPDGS